MELESYTATLTWGDDSPYAGLEAVLNLNASADMYWATLGVGSGEAFVAMLRRFGDEVLVSWNREDNGAPVPADGDGFMAQPYHLVRFLIQEWRAAAVNPPLPLSKRQPSGATSEVASAATVAA